MHSKQELNKSSIKSIDTKLATSICQVISAIKNNTSTVVDWNMIPIDDMLTYDLFSRGDVAGIYRFDELGIDELCRKFKFKNLSHIMAIQTIYQPGPREFIPDFIKRSQNKAKLVYMHDIMKDILEDTYGVILYGKQFIQIMHRLAGFSQEDAILLSSIVGRRRYQVFENNKERFIKGCYQHNHIKATTALQIWNKLTSYGKYGFYHSYDSETNALIAYRTAFLKTHYPTEFNSICNCI